MPTTEIHGDECRYCTAKGDSYPELRWAVCKKHYESVPVMEELEIIIKRLPAEKVLNAHH